MECGIILSQWSPDTLQKRDSEGLNPAQIAVNSGHVKLASELEKIQNNKTSSEFGFSLGFTMENISLSMSPSLILSAQQPAVEQGRLSTNHATREKVLKIESGIIIKKHHERVCWLQWYVWLHCSVATFPTKADVHWKYIICMPSHASW